MDDVTDALSDSAARSEPPPSGAAVEDGVAPAVEGMEREPSLVMVDVPPDPPPPVAAALPSSSSNTTPAPLQQTLTQAMDTIVGMLHTTAKTFEDARGTLSREPLSAEQRAQLWRSAANVEKTVLEHRGLFWLLSEAGLLGPNTTQQVDIDVKATVAHHPRLSGSVDAEGNVGAVVKAYMQYRPSLAYTTGLPHLVALLLCNCPDPEEAFWMLVALMEDGGFCALTDAASSRAASEALIHCLPHVVGQHLQSLALHTAEYLRPWLGSGFAQAFDPRVAEVVLDVVWSSDRKAFIPIRVASSLHALFKSEILACHTVADALVYFQTVLPRVVTVDLLRRALALGDWFYLRNPLPLPMVDALAKGPKLDKGRARKLEVELSRRFDTGDSSARATATVSKVWGLAKAWGTRVTARLPAGPQPEGGTAQPKCPYHLYECHCTPVDTVAK
eukprot:GGOE01036894.1.p1 GENE.GGOE01036894.1~~GGOE01036894.1.p1  ORF type:complete len:452 (-),score=111.00 GGOE01036894.1:148-1482(-)